MSASQASRTIPPSLEIRLLGRFEVYRNGLLIPESAWGRRKTKTLLKILLTTPGVPFTQDQLIDALFSDSSVRRAKENLYGRVSELRRALEPDLKRGADSRFIRREGEGYAFFLPSGCSIDALGFEASASRALWLVEQERWIEAVETLEEGTRQYRGDFLPEDRYEDWAAVCRERLRALYLDGLEQLAEGYGRLGRRRQAILCCRRILAEEPVRESVIRQLMKHEHASGHRARALEAYKTGEKALWEYLDVEPDSRTRRLYKTLSQAVEEDRQLDPRRLAVIPFVNVGGDPAHAHLADGMTEALIYALSQVTGLAVIAQTTVLQYKGVARTAAEIGQELDVGSLLEGSVQPFGDRARVVVQLIDSETQMHRWAHQYDLDLSDVLSIQGRIAQRVTQALEVRLLRREHTAICRIGKISRESQTDYLKAQQLLRKRTMKDCQEAMELLDRVLSVEPEYPLALAALAEAHAFTASTRPADPAFGKAMECARKSLELDPGCAEAHAVLGHVMFWHRGDFHAAEAEYLQAIDLNPNCVLAFARYADLLSTKERFHEACHWSEQALEINPLSLDLIVSYAQCLHSSGRLVEALDQYQKALEINPTHVGVWWGTWYCLAASWDWNRAEAFTRGLVEKYPENPWATIDLATCVMCRGRLDEGLDLIRELLEREPEPKRAFVLEYAGHCHYFGREYETAIRFYRRSLERNPISSWNHNMIAKCLIMQERYQEALDELDAAQSVFQGDDKFWNRHTRMDRATIYARTGRVAQAERLLEDALNDAGRLNGRIAVGGILIALGRMDEAFEWFERAATAREPHMAATLKSPAMEEHLSDPRYQAILKRIGLWPESMDELSSLHRSPEC